MVPQVIAALKNYGREDIMVIVGGVIPSQDYQFLFDAGAVGVGMGSALCGKDITTPAGEDYEEQFKTAKKSWAEHGKAAAQTALDTLQ